MKVRAIRRIVENCKEDELIVGFLYDKWLANENVRELNEGITEADDLTPELTDTEWETIHNAFHKDKYVWTVIDTVFDGYIQRALLNREAANVN